MSSSKEVARAINCFARECLDLLGSSDGSTLFGFVEEYLCGDDPDDNEDDLFSGKVLFQQKTQLYQTHSGTDETKDGDLAAAGNIFTFTTHNNACIKLTKSKLDSYDNGLEDDGSGDSPLFVDVEEAVASIPADILDPPSDLTRAPAATVASPESVSEGTPTPDSLETAESSVVSLCKKLKS